MRISLAILTMAAVFTAAPARSQTYDPAHPVCLQAYAIGGGYIDCSYSSLAQCNATASGQSALCIVNPYFAGANAPAGANYRRGRGGYYSDFHFTRATALFLPSPREAAGTASPANASLPPTPDPSPPRARARGGEGSEEHYQLMRLEP